MHRPHRIAVVTLMLLGLAAPVARAAGLQVAPILLEFKPGEAAQALRLSNASQAPLRAQVRVLAWTQSAGREHLQPTRDLVASPPIMELAPGQIQLVRIVRLQPGAASGELAYRLLVDELPDAGAGRLGVQLLLRHSVPLFVLPPGAKTAPERRGKAEPSELEVEARPGPDGAVLSVRNKGQQRVRLSQLAFEGADGQATPLEPGLLGYVHAGQRMQWTVPLPADRHSGGGTFKARLNDDAEPKALPVASPAR